MAVCWAEKARINGRGGIIQRRTRREAWRIYQAMMRTMRLMGLDIGTWPISWGARMMMMLMMMIWRRCSGKVRRVSRIGVG